MLGRRRYWAIPAGLLAASVFAGIALANNVHTVGEWYHGLGDGANNNYYVHPFNENTLGHAHCNTLELYSGAGKVYGTLACNTTHHHTDWDTGLALECGYFSRHEAAVHVLNLHTHRHHDPC